MLQALPLDRDLLLFQTGVAAGRNAKPWQWSTAILGASCMALSVLLILGNESPRPVLAVAPAEPTTPAEAMPTTPEPYSLISLMQRGETATPPQSDRGSPVDPAVPLRIGMRSFDDDI